MSKFNKTFSAGEVLKAAKLNELVTAANDSADKAESVYAPTEITEGKDLAYVTGIGTDGKTKKISLDNFGKEEVLHELAWGVTINPNTSSPALTMKGNASMWTEYKEKMGRYLVTNAGVAKKLMHNDSTKFIDGTTVDETQGHIMVRIPRLYYKSVTNSDGSTTLWMCEQPIGGHEIKEQWVGAYLGYMAGTALTSRSGVKPAASKTINQFWTAAQVNGEHWGLANYEHRKLFIMLHISEYLSLNSQGTLGNGMVNSQWKWTDEIANKLTGKTVTLGDACGSVTDGYTENADAAHVSLFGIEDPYGWYWEMVQGCYFGSSNNAAQDGTECFLYEGNRMPSSAELTTEPTGDFRKLTRLTSEGWIKAILAGDKFDVFAKTLGGGSTTYWCDYNYANATGQLLLWGGSAHSGALCGLAFSRSSYGWSGSSSNLGSRLAYYGEVTID